MSILARSTWHSTILLCFYNGMLNCSLPTVRLNCLFLNPNSCSNSCRLPKTSCLAILSISWQRENCLRLLLTRDTPRNMLTSSIYRYRKQFSAMFPWR